MDTLSIYVSNLIANIGEHFYIVASVGLLFIMLLIHLYSSKKEKQRLRHIIDQHVSVFKHAFHHATDAIVIISHTHEVLFYNKAFIELTGFNEKEVEKLLKKELKVYLKKEWITLIELLQHHLSKQTPTTFSHLTIQSSPHKKTEINLYIDAEKTSSNKLYYIITFEDISEIEHYKEQLLQHQLTKLPNQIKALQELPKLFSKIHTLDKKIALILFSIDNYLGICSVIGIKQSNDILVKFATYLTTINNQFSPTTYHMHDNHFLMTLSNIDTHDEVTSLVRSIQKELSHFYRMENINLHLTVSAGIAIYPESGSPRTLLDNAYKALEEAEREGDNKIIIYDSNIAKSNYDEMRLHNDMQIGLANGQFEVYYQPIVSTKTKEVVAAEALIRWIHPEFGFIPPDIFIGLMEKTGFIVELGRFILEEVLKQQKRWELFKFKDIEVSINVSMVEIATGEFVEHVAKRLKHHKVYPGKIKFEITEGVAMIGEEQTERYFQKLHNLGVGISLDDFGTGYTSFGYLKKFPANTLKIDKSLVDYILTSKEDQRIVHAMIELGHNMGMKVVVEGVENKEMVELLSQYGCDLLQGYYFSKPLPVFEFQKLLRDEKIER